MTDGDLFPDRRNVPDVLRTVAQARRRAARCRASRLARRFVRGLLQARARRAATSPSSRAGIDTLATLLRERGYHVAFKGKWHLSKPVNGADWSAADSERIERDYGFAEWEPPDAGGDAKAETFGGGNAGYDPRGLGRGLHAPGGGWLGRAQTCPSRSAWSSRSSTRTTCSAIRPRTRRAATRSRTSATSACRCRRRVDEDLREKPTVHSLMKLGQTAYIGALERRAGPAGLRRTSTPTCTGWWTRRSAGCWPRSATRPTRARCARAR